MKDETGPRRRPRWRLPLGLVALTGLGASLLPAPREGAGRDAVTLSRGVLAIIFPALICVAVLRAPRWFRAARDAAEDRRARRWPDAAGPPIERIAVDLRRLLWQHELLARTTGLAGRAQRLWTLEAAIGDCAAVAARALEVAHPQWGTGVRPDRAALRELLRALAAEGLVLPHEVRLLSPDNRI